MSHFGYKVIERSRPELEPIVESAIALRCPIEIGLYADDPLALAFLEERLPGSGLPVMVHLDHRRLSLFGLEKREQALRGQLEQAVRLGARYVITHCSPYPVTARTEHHPQVLHHLLRGLETALNACGEMNLGLHIENTYDDLAFYQTLFQTADEAGLSGVQFCFDIGHAKIWSTCTLADWMVLLRDLDAAGRRIHVHLHANGGFEDDHLSFLSAEARGLTRPDGFTASLDYYQALAEIDATVPNAIKVFEVPASEALENRSHVLRRLAALSDAPAKT